MTSKALKALRMADWREANSDYHKNYRNKHRARTNENRRNRYAALTPEEKERLALKKKASVLKRKYSLTHVQWQDLFALQGSRCAGCKTDNPGKSGWATDHCHATGRVRGILCHDCNKALGFTKDNPETLRSLIAYLAGEK